MISVLVDYSIEAAPIAVILYAVIWRVMGKRDGRRLRWTPPGTLSGPL